MGALKNIRINGETYPCDVWVSEQSGQVVRYEWEDGWLGGMGHLTKDSDDGRSISITIVDDYGFGVLDQAYAIAATFAADPVTS